MALDLTTDAPEGTTIAIEIRDTPGKNGWTAPYSLPARTTQPVVIPLAEVAKKIQVAHIAEFLLFKSRPESDLNVYVDNVRLISPTMFAMQTALDEVTTALGMLWMHQGNGAAQPAQLAALIRFNRRPA